MVAGTKETRQRPKADFGASTSRQSFWNWLHEMLKPEADSSRPDPSAQTLTRCAEGVVDPREARQRQALPLFAGLGSTEIDTCGFDDLHKRSVARYVA